MRFQMGTDEAGYGPNLGPLTITGTLFEAMAGETELYHALKECVSDSLSEAVPERMVIADSKKIFGSSKHIGSLELPVLAILWGAFQIVPKDWRHLLEIVCGSAVLESISDQIWLVGRSLELPLEADLDQVRRLGDRFRENCSRVGVRLTAIECRVVFPPQFNRDLETFGNKANLLSTETLQMVGRLLAQTRLSGEIGCDKHGGRSRYAGMIQQVLAVDWVDVGIESREISTYGFEQANRQIQIRFKSKGESFLPTALASMVSKYVRELMMKIWNAYWRDHLPDLKPTQGYPQDAKRFLSEIAAKQLELGIAQESIWRNK